MGWDIRWRNRLRQSRMQVDDMMGIVSICMGIVCVWQGILGKRFYRSGADVGPWVKAPTWQGRLMFLAVGSFAIWKGISLLRGA